MWVYTAIASAAFFGMAIALTWIRDHRTRKELERERADRERNLGGGNEQPSASRAATTHGSGPLTNVE
jgi:preprotein translocase subunit SecG